MKKKFRTIRYFSEIRYEPCLLDDIQFLQNNKLRTKFGNKLKLRPTNAENLIPFESEFQLYIFYFSFFENGKMHTDYFRFYVVLMSIFPTIKFKCYPFSYELQLKNTVDGIFFSMYIYIGRYFSVCSLITRQWFHLSRLNFQQAISVMHGNIFKF